MQNIQECLGFVKEQHEFHVRMAEKFSDNPKRSLAHQKTAFDFQNLYNFLESLQKKKAQGPAKLALTWDEVADLPPELVAELSISETDKTEFNILSVVEDLGGVASLDRILVGYFHLTGEIVKRSVMNNRIYRMIQKESLFAVPGKKGVYSIEPFTEGMTPDLD